MIKQKRIITCIVLIICLILVGSYLFMVHKSLPVNIFLPISLEQDASFYLPDNYPLNKSMLSRQQLLAKKKDFLQRFFSVWISKDDQFCLNADEQECRSIISMQEDTIKDFEQTRGFDRFYQAYQPVWLDVIKANMALDQLAVTLKQEPRYGIIVENAALRVLPTAEPNFNEVITPGEGYPFDRIQESAIWLGTPVRILHTSKDKQWQLVLGSGLLGWVPVSSVALVNETFIHNYQNSTWVTPITRQIDVLIDKQHAQRLYLGSLYPLLSSSGDSYQLAIPVMGRNQHAVLRLISAPKVLLQLWPLKPTPYQFTLLMNQLVGMPYGWGDLDFNSDCSGMLRRLYTAFAIWLPRNSYSQAHFGGKFYSLADIAIEQRKQILTAGNTTIPKPIPYLTILSFGSKASTPGQKSSIGHIALYLGTKNNTAIIMQSAWGLKIYKGNNSIGRAIMGKAVITPITAGEEVHLPLGLKLHTLLESSELGITFLN